GAALAELLELPRVAVVTKIDLAEGTATVNRELEGGLVDIVEVDTPALLTIQTGINEPRYATLRAIKQAEEKEIEVRQPHQRGEVRPITHELISAAKELEGSVAVAVIAKDPSALTDTVDVEGVDEILTVKVEQDEFENDVYQQAVEQLVRDRAPKTIMLGFTVNSMGFGPALAAKLGCGFASDVFSIDAQTSGLVVQRAFYGSKVHAEVEFPNHDQVILLLRPTAWAPAEGKGNAVEEEVSVSIDGSRARHKDFVEL